MQEDEGDGQGGHRGGKEAGLLRGGRLPSRVSWRGRPCQRRPWQQPGRSARAPTGDDGAQYEEQVLQ
eukprot:4068363-Pyramimonas_sp.AAC.1